MVNSKYAFLQALVVTIIIFGIGVLLGFFLENSRTGKIELTLLNSEINLLDEQIRSRGIGQMEINCDISLQSTFDFANEVYYEALKLEDYGDASKFTDDLKILHKRYDLLRMMLWMESIELREKCHSDFHTVIYFYDYGTEDLTLKAEQSAVSRLLFDLKNKHGTKILLIPIASNLNLNSVNIILQKYDISKSPAIIIDEEKVVDWRATLEEIEKEIFEQAVPNTEVIRLN